MWRKAEHHFVEAYIRDIIIGITAGLVVSYVLSSFSFIIGLVTIIFIIISLAYYWKYYTHPPHQ